MEWLTTEIDFGKLASDLVGFLPQLLVAVLIVAAFWLVYRVTRRSLRSILQRSGMDRLLTVLLVDKVYRIAIMVIGLVMGASQLGIDVGAALAGLGVAGVAIGFAAKDILANVIAGFTIFMDEPFASGDYVHVAGEYGRVEEVTLRSTRLRTLNNTYVVLPNSRAVDEVVVNDSKHGSMRLEVPLGIAYKEDIGRAREVLLEAVSGMEGVMEDPAPDVVADELGSSSVNLLVRVWLADAGSAKPLHFRVMEASKRALDAADIEIPFPHLQLFVDTVEDRVVRKIAEVPELARVSGS